MFNLGNNKVGKYNIWIAPPMFVEASDDLYYYEVLVNRQENTFVFNVNPVKEILNLDLTDRNPLDKPKDKEHLAPEELEFRIEHQAYLSRKEMIMPLWKLSRRHVEELFSALENK